MARLILQTHAEYDRMAAICERMPNAWLDKMLAERKYTLERKLEYGWPA